MFFKTIDTWGQKKTKRMRLLFDLIFYLFSLVAPVIIIATKYSLYKKASYSLTMAGAIVVVIIAVVLLRSLKKGIAKLPQDDYKQQKIKFTAQWIYHLLVPVGVLVALYLIKNDFQTAYETMWLCMIFLTIGTCIEWNFCAYIDARLNLMDEAKHQQAVEEVKNHLGK